MLNLNTPITGKQIGIWFIGAVATVVTLIVLSYAASWAWKKGQE